MLLCFVRNAVYAVSLLLVLSDSSKQSSSAHKSAHAAAQAAFSSGQMQLHTFCWVVVHVFFRLSCVCCL